MTMPTLQRTSFTVLLATGLAAPLAANFSVPVFAADPAVTTDIGTLDQETAEKAFPARPPYSPYAGRNFPTRPFFGDTHLHTSFSMDAGAFGARLGPRDAYRFAKGEEVIASSGQHAKLSRPLDFLVVTDHSDGMGFFPQLMSADPALLATPQGGGSGRRYHYQFRQRSVAEGFPDAGYTRLPQRMAGDDQGGGGG
jgi:hypothetical protein